MARILEVFNFSPSMPSSDLGNCKFSLGKFDLRVETSQDGQTQYHYSAIETAAYLLTAAAQLKDARDCLSG